MPNVIEKIDALSERLERARRLVAENRVHPVIGLTSHYIVESSTGDGYYLVNGECSCPDSKHREQLTSRLCKHKLAAVMYEESRSASLQ
jgi:hypothetical protein